MTKHQICGVGVGLILLILGVGWYSSLRPSALPALHVEGVDKYDFHRPFAGARTVGHTFVAPTNTIPRIDVLIVDLKRQSNQAPITLTLSEDGASEPARVVSVGGDQVRDDQYVSFLFDPPLVGTQGRPYTLTLSAPEAAGSAPYAVRLNESGDIEFKVFRTVPLYKVWGRWLQHVRSELVYLGGTLLAALGFILIVWHGGREGKSLYVVAGIFFLLAAGGELYLLRYVTADPGEDSITYLYITRALLSGHNPFLANELRLPGYPLLLMPAFLPGVPDLLWARLVSVAASIGVGLLLFPLARRLQITVMVPLVSAFLLYSNKDFLLTSIRPLPYTVYTFLLLLSLVLLFSRRTLGKTILWGVVLGYMGMTRQEAFVPIAILLAVFVAQLVHEKVPRQQMWPYVLAAFVPAVVLIAPYFLNNWYHYGSPFHTPYLTYRDDLNQPHSLAQFMDENVPRAWGVLGSTWRPFAGQEVQLAWEGKFRIISIVVIALFVGQRWVPWPRQWKRVEWIYGVAAALLSCILLYSLIQWSWFHQRSLAKTELNMVMVVLMGLGIVEIIRIGRGRGLVVVAVLLSQLLIPTWLHPFSKHYQQSLPLLALGMGAVLVALSGIPTRSGGVALAPKRIWLRLLPAALSIALFLVPVWVEFPMELDRYNGHAAWMQVRVAAGVALASLPGTIAVEQWESEALLYVKERAIEFDSSRTGSSDQLRWLHDKEVDYVVDTNEVAILTAPEDSLYASSFEAVGRWQALDNSGKELWMTIYKVR